jgi:hypothetical protein
MAIQTWKKRHEPMMMTKTIHVQYRMWRPTKRFADVTAHAATVVPNSQTLKSWPVTERVVARA